MYGNTSLLYESPKNCAHVQSVYKASGGAGDEANTVGAYDVITEWRLVKVNVDDVSSGEPARVYKASPQGEEAGDEANIVGAYDVIASEGSIQGECR